MHTILLWTLVVRLVSAARDPSSFAAKINQRCPENLVRSTPVTNQTINELEHTYVRERMESFPQAWQDWIGDGSDIGYDLNKLHITSNNGSGLPVIAIAVSGGGYR